MQWYWYTLAQLGGIWGARSAVIAVRRRRAEHHSGRPVALSERDKAIAAATREWRDLVADLQTTVARFGPHSKSARILHELEAMCANNYVLTRQQRHDKQRRSLVEEGLCPEARDERRDFLDFALRRGDWRSRWEAAVEQAQAAVTEVEGFTQGWIRYYVSVAECSEWDYVVSSTRANLRKVDNEVQNDLPSGEGLSPLEGEQELDNRVASLRSVVLVFIAQAYAALSQEQRRSILSEHQDEAEQDALPYDISNAVLLRVIQARTAQPVVRPPVQPQWSRPSDEHELVRHTGLTSRPASAYARPGGPYVRPGKRR